MDDLLGEFLSETMESLCDLEQKLMQLENDPDNSDIIRDIFRVLHTIKGTCGFLGLQRLEKLAHVSESLLGKLRDNELKVGPVIMGTLLVCVDRLRHIVEETIAGNTHYEGPEDDDILRALHVCMEGDNLSSVTVAEHSPPLEEIEPPKILAEEPSVEEAPALEEVEMDVAVAVEADPVPSVPVMSTPTPEKTDKAAAEKASPDKAPVEMQQFIRVNIEVLDHLINLVSELVLTRNQLLQLLQGHRDHVFHAPLSRLSYITSELQESVMKTRMQSIENAWTKFPRIVRELSRELNKKIDLIQQGGDTELDRQVLELIKDPLTHMIRNSCDHGMELPQERLDKGKPETGSVTLKAYHEGGEIIIEIVDDGRGIDPNKIRSKILEKGLVSADECEKLSDWQVLNYIFKAGFSTAEKLTSVSGRGVGMDVVRGNIEKIGGVIELESQVDKGTRFIIKIPLTLTIISALIMETSNERFAIPQLTVSELVRVSERSQYQIEYINQNPILRLRKSLLPLIFLADLLGLDRDRNQTDYCIVVTNVGNIAYGIVVDRVFDIQEIVVKPLSRMLQNISIFSGNTILGDGSIVMIVDPNTIANDLAQNGTRNMAVDATQGMKQPGDESLLLIFRVREQYFSVPLAIVTRIAEIQTHQLEYVNETWLIKYSGHLLPVEKLDGEPPLDAQDLAQNPYVTPMLVFSDRGLAMGLIVEEIITIMEERFEVEIKNRKAGVLGSTLLGGRTTSVIDCEHYLRKAHPDWFEHFASGTQSGQMHRRIKILLVDDSQFFRNLVLPVLTMSDFEVLTADNGELGLKMCRMHKDFDLIISDIEMPVMDGFEMVQGIRTMPNYEKTTVVALSSRVSDQDIAHGKKCGFTQHFSKSDQRGLVDYLQKFRQELLSQELLQ